ncbi:SDR family NAD(P)-dependent oxidoreductase [Amycolatopsis keratiniphila]|uniref:SDR family NAD(P)-dependent oxidoreductase n=1 Tax=Amycolatopsis keratiniphila TaxID=129921 RepID=UPI001E5BDFFB|nr:SDR family NAD(P)-dependent oxidoreductase [Amycolatopsis keratiniphila]
MSLREDGADLLGDQGAGLEALDQGRPGEAQVVAAGGESGAIVQMSSMGGQQSPPGFGASCSAKFALEAMSESLAAEVAPFGVKLLIVEPGAFRTEFGGSRLHRSRVIDAYRESTGDIRDFVERMDGSQPGDPAKAAAAILKVLDSDDAVDGLRATHEARAAELAAWEELSRSTAL